MPADLGISAAIACLKNGMELAWHRYQTDARYRRRCDAEEFAVASYYEAQRKGLIERVKPKKEWLDWPTDNGGAA